MLVDIYKFPQLDIAFFNSLHPREVTFWQACALIYLARNNGLSVALAQGVFDFFHQGHFEYLLRASQLADVLVVGLENDLTAKEKKGQNRPYNPVEERMKAVSSLSIAQFVFPYINIPRHDHPDDFISRLIALQPNYLAVSEFDPNLERKRIQTQEAGVSIVVLPG